MKVLLTGGAGYIGSHTAVLLLEKGDEVVIVDDLSNSKKVVMDRIYEITGKRAAFYPYNVCDEEKMREVFQKEQVDAVIHYAGFKAVGESVEKPLAYYDNNLGSVLTMLKLMKDFDVHNIVFSSSATVYGNPPSMPIREDFPLSTASPYGSTKLMIEQILTDTAAADPTLNVVILRYFNPVGAHVSGLIGEDPKGIPNNLIPYIAQVAIGKRERLSIYGNDYPTPDGTCIRDYIHVVDLAKGHIAALKLFGKENFGRKVYNLGSGKGSSVLEMVQAFSKAIGKEIPYVFADRRAGDLPESYARCEKAWNELGWKTEKTVEEMCEDVWRWQQKNPDGYGDD